jgi:hypothetical protein
LSSWCGECKYKVPDTLRRRILYLLLSLSACSDPIPSQGDRAGHVPRDVTGASEGALAQILALAVRVRRYFVVPAGVRSRGRHQLRLAGGGLATASSRPRGPIKGAHRRRVWLTPVPVSVGVLCRPRGPILVGSAFPRRLLRSSARGQCVPNLSHVRRGW